jgi:hypothetical protein
MAYIGKSPTAAPLTSSDVTDDIITLAKMAGGTDGNIITYDASGNPAVVATGTDGQVLTSTGAGSPPAFETLSAGGMTQLNETDISSSNGTSFRISTDTSTYNLLFISIGGVSSAASTSGAMPDFKLGFNNDTTSGNYNMFRINDDQAGSFSQSTGDQDGFYFNGSGFAGFEYLNAQAIWVYAPGKSDRYKLVSYTSMGQQDGQAASAYLKIIAGGIWKNNNAITECTFTSASTLTTGKITIFGMK